MYIVYSPLNRVMPNVLDFKCALAADPQAVSAEL